MRRQLVGAVAGLALLLALSGEARPATGTPKTPPPTVTVSMETPEGAQPNPTSDAGWTVNRPGIEGGLWVEGKTPDAPGASELPLLPASAPFRTTITALWTSNLLKLSSRKLNANVVLSWSDGMPPGATGRQQLRIRWCDTKGHWGRWTALYDKPFADSIATYLTTGGPDPVTFGSIKYPGKVPVKGIRIQFSLTDALPQGSVLDQSLAIDLDPASHGEL